MEYIKDKYPGCICVGSLAYLRKDPGQSPDRELVEIRAIYMSNSKPYADVYNHDTDQILTVGANSLIYWPRIYLQERLVRKGDTLHYIDESGFWRTITLLSITLAENKWTLYGHDLGTVTVSEFFREQGPSIEGKAVKIHEIVYFKRQVYRIEGIREVGSNWEAKLFALDGTLIWADMKDLTYALPKRKIKIGNVEINAPEVEVLQNETKYYVPYISGSRLHVSYIWTDDKLDLTFLQKGLVHLSPEDADAHAKAVLELTKQAK